MDILTVAAAVDRIIYGEDKTFLVEDAKLLAEVIPVQRRKLLGIKVNASIPGGKSSGHAAGVGNVDLKDEGRKFKFEVGQDKFFRAGQYKIKRHSDGIQIWKVMGNPFEESAKGALLEFDSAGNPKALKSFAPKRLVIPIPYCPFTFMIDGWRDWKTPVSH